MPNHYHFLIYATEISALMKLSGNIEVSELSNGFRLLQSTYAKHINKQLDRTGSLFKQKAQAKSTHDGDKHYELTAFRYIHQNPLEAQLVSDLKKWPYSSYPDYADIRNGTTCDKEFAFKLIGLEKGNFVEESYKEIDPNDIAKLFYRTDKW